MAGLLVERPCVVSVQRWCLRSLMSEMVRADHFDLDVRPAVASTERVMATAFPALWHWSAACGFRGGPGPFRRSVLPTRVVPLDPEEDRTALFVSTSRIRLVYEWSTQMTILSVRTPTIHQTAVRLDSRLHFPSSQCRKGFGNLRNGI